MELPLEAADLARLIDGARAGDRNAVDRLFTLVYDELRKIARRVRRGRPDPTLETTALVHEAYLRLTQSRKLELVDRAHFTWVAARAMRQVLIALARRRAALKRSSAVLVTLDEQAVGKTVPLDRILALEEALSDLQQADPRRAAVVECRLFGGMDVEETALALNVSSATVKRDWRFARAWLARALA